MHIFFDTSTLVKRYIEEKGSDETAALFLKASQVSTSLICLPEIMSALNRVLREKKLNKSLYAKTKKMVINDFKDFLIYDLTSKVITYTITLLENTPLKAMDALHLACALEAKPDLFVSSDIQQIKAAKKLHLKVLQI